MVTYHGTQCKVAVKTAAPAFGDWLATDQVQSVSFEFEGSLMDVYVMGDRDPQAVKEGTIAITGTIERNFGPDNFSASAVKFNELATAAVLLGWEVALFPEGDAAPKVLITGVKFGSYSMSADLGDVAKETISFKGLAIAVT